jgi:predicted dehydrogenase
MHDANTPRITRRDFTKVSAAAGFAILSASKAKAQSSETLKFGLLGCGGRGTGAAMQMMQGNDNVQLIAVADLFEDKAKSARKKYEETQDPSVQGKVAIDDDHVFHGFDAYEKLLASDIDILIEGTLPYSRPKHITAAVEAGKHIFTEKPAAVDPAGIREFIAAAKKAEEKGLSFVTGTQRRYQWPYVETIKKIHDGAIGDVLAMRAYWCGTLPFAHPRTPDQSDFEHCMKNWYAFCWVCGDNIVEQHVHNIDVANWVMGGPPKSVFASGGRAWKDDDPVYGDLWDHFSCDFEYEGGVQMTSMCRHWGKADGDVSEQVTGTKGRSNCRDMQDTPNEKLISPYIQEHIELVKSIREEGPYLNEGVRMAESTLTAIMGRMSAYEGKRYTWEEAMNSELSIVPEEWSFEKDYPTGPIPRPGMG